MVSLSRQDVQKKEERVISETNKGVKTPLPNDMQNPALAGREHHGQIGR